MAVVDTGSELASRTAGRNAVLGGGLAALSILLACCVLWFVVDPLKYAVIGGQRAGLGGREAVAAAVLQLPAAGWVLIATAMAAAGATLVIEIRSRAVSAATGGRHRLAALLVFGAVLLWFGHAYLYSGHLLGGDTGAHIARIAHFANGLRQGELRHWDNAFYGGAPFLQFTGPLFFWLGGAVAWIVQDATLGAKLVLFLLHFASGWTAYRLLRGFGLSRAASGIGSVVYAGAFAHLHLILYKGALPQAVILALLPAAFLAVDRLATVQRQLRRPWSAAVLAVAGMVVAHQPHGLVAGLYVAGFVLANLACRRYAWPALLRCATAALAAGVLASFAVVPWLIESREVMASGSTNPLFWEWPDLDYFRKLLIWSNRWTSIGAPSVAYVGLTSAALALVAVLLAVRGRSHDRALVAIFAILLLISFGFRGDYLRDIIFTLFFISLLAGFGAQRILEWPGASDRAALLVLFVVFLDFAVPAVQPLARTDKGYLDEASAYLASRPQSRRVVLSNSYAAPDESSRLRVEIGPSTGPISYRPVQTLSGPHNMAATRLHNYAVAALKKAEADLRRAGRLAPDTEQLLAMLNAGLVVNDSGSAMGLPKGIAAAVEEGPLGRVLLISDATPAVFAPELVEIVPPAEADKPVLWDSDFDDGRGEQVQAVGGVLETVLRDMRLLPGTPTAAAIPVRAIPEGVPAPAAQSEAPAAESSFAVLDYTVEAQRVRMVLRVPQTGYVQLAHPWYPFQKTTVDGQDVAPLRGTLNLLVLAVPAGEHVVEIVAERSALRRGFGIGCTVLLLIVVGAGLWPYRRSAS